MRGVFFSGTDTAVGKTWCATRLCRYLVDTGVSLHAKKPIESGADQQLDSHSDARRYQRALGAGADINNIRRYYLAGNCSTAAAAQNAGLQLELQQLVEFCQADHGFTIVEGAGGLCSPLCAAANNADLAKALALPVVLVVKDALGCINHCLLSWHYLQARELSLTAVVLNKPEPSAPSFAAELRAALPACTPLIHSDTPAWCASLSALLAC